MDRKKIEDLTYAGIFGAISFLLMAFAQFPIVPGYNFLRFDPGEAPALLVGLVRGPRVGFMAVVIKDLLYLLFRAKSPFGPAADFLACSTFVVVTSVILKRGTTSGRRIFSAAVMATLARILIMVPGNVLILGLQFGYSFGQVLETFWPVIVPFNVVKSLTNTVLALPLVLYLSRHGIAPKTSIVKPNQ
jgi:riboflavin transporter FmnP